VRLPGKFRDERRSSPESTRQNPAGLTRREMDVLRLIDLGKANAEIGNLLFISSKTVDHHISAILAKLNTRSRSKAASFARKLGMLE
jgi:DNA-binding NarL/FixJ family response regulator